MEGIWLYDGAISCRVIITNEDFLPGSGDYEDDPEVRGGKLTPCFQIWFENPAKPNDFNASRHAKSLQDALDVLRAMQIQIQWKS